MEDRERLLKGCPEFDRLAFTVLAIEASAQKMGISPSEMRRRLDKVGLIKNLIQDCYETLHTESRETVANDVVEALNPSLILNIFFHQFLWPLQLLTS